MMLLDSVLSFQYILIYLHSFKDMLLIKNRVELSPSESGGH